MLLDECLVVGPAWEDSSGWGRKTSLWSWGKLTLCEKAPESMIESPRAPKEELSSDWEPAGPPRRVWCQNQEVECVAHLSRGHDETWMSIVRPVHRNDDQLRSRNHHSAQPGTSDSGSLYIHLLLKGGVRGRERWEILNWWSLNSEFTMFKYGNYGVTLNPIHTYTRDAGIPPDKKLSWYLKSSV